MRKVIIINGIDVSKCNYYEDGMCQLKEIVTVIPILNANLIVQTVISNNYKR